MCIRQGTLQWQCFVSEHHCISLHDDLRAFRRQNWISPTSDMPKPLAGWGPRPLAGWDFGTMHLSLPRVEPRLRPALSARLLRHDVSNQWGRKEPATQHGEARCATQSSAKEALQRTLPAREYATASAGKNDRRNADFLATTYEMPMAWRAYAGFVKFIPVEVETSSVRSRPDLVHLEL